MGLEDRDYFWIDRAKRESVGSPSDEKPKPGELHQAGQRRPPNVVIRKGPPDLIGANWHWSIKVLIYLGIVALLLGIWRLLR